MRFGKTYEELKQEDTKELSWRVEYSWLPCRLKDGRLAWLEKVNVRKVRYWSDTFGCYLYYWEYEAIDD